jgi:hypothetical protein
VNVQFRRVMDEAIIGVYLDEYVGVGYHSRRFYTSMLEVHDGTHQIWLYFD